MWEFCCEERDVKEHALGMMGECTMPDSTQRVVHCVTIKRVEST